MPPFIHQHPLFRAVLGRLTVWVCAAVLFATAAGWIAVDERGECHSAERWTSLNGTTTVEADFIGLWGNNVVLEMAGSRRVSVNIDNLIAESRILARRLGDEQKLRRAEAKQQILAHAKEAAAPAPTPLPAPRSAPDYQRLTSGGGLLAQLEWQDQQCNNGHVLLAMFDSMPPSHQADLERLLRMGVDKIDMQGVRQALGAMHSVGDLIVTRQRWLFSYPRLSAMDPDSRQSLQAALLPVGGLLRDGLDPNQLKIEDLATMPLRNWLEPLDARIAPHIAEISTHFESLGIQASAYEVKSEKDGKATVEITSGIDKQSRNFVAIDGIWVPADMDTKEWTERTKSWEESLASSTDGAMLAGGTLLLIPLIDPFVQPALDAKSARELHAVMDGWMPFAAPLLAQVGSLGKGNRNRNGYNSGYDGYDSSYEDMDMTDYYEDVGMDDTQ